MTPAVSEAGLFTSASLTFLPQPHEYRLPDGRVVPSVTQILRAVGCSTDFDALKESSRWRSERIDRKRDLGTALHQDAHAYDDDDLIWSTVHPEVRPYLEAWAEARVNLSLKPLLRERRVFHPGLFYSGTLDGLFELPNGRIILADLKTGDPRDSGGHLQTAAYEAAYCFEHPEARVDERWSVQLVPGRRIPYLVTNYTAREDAWRDPQRWAACVTTFWEQPCRLKKL